jgi:hypothetical protein
MFAKSSLGLLPDGTREGPAGLPEPGQEFEGADSRAASRRMLRFGLPALLFSTGVGDWEGNGARPPPGVYDVQLGRFLGAAGRT